MVQAPPGLTREDALDAAAGSLLRNKPEGTAIFSLSIYAPGEGGSSDPDVVTFMWELAYSVDDDRDSDWAHDVQAGLATTLERELGS